MEFSIHWMFYGAAALYFTSLAAYLLKKTRATVILLALGFVIHTAYLLSRGWITGMFIPNYMFDGVLFLPWGIAFFTLVKKLTANDDTPWESAVVMLCFFTIIALIYPKGIIPPTPKKTIIWVPLFFLTEVLGHAGFYCGAWFAMLSLRGKSPENSYHTFIIWGFLSYTVAQIVGAVWCYQGWAFTFKWSSRHMFSAALWCYFIIYLHLKFLPGWNTRKKTWFAAAGFFVVLILSSVGYFHEMFFPRIGG